MLDMETVYRVSFFVSPAGCARSGEQGRPAVLWVPRKLGGGFGVPSGRASGCWRGHCGKGATESQGCRAGGWAG